MIQYTYSDRAYMGRDARPHGRKSPQKHSTIARAVALFATQGAWRWEHITRELGPGASRDLTALKNAGFITRQPDGWWMRWDLEHLDKEIAKRDAEIERLNRRIERLKRIAAQYRDQRAGGLFDNDVRREMDAAKRHIAQLGIPALIMAQPFGDLVRRLCALYRDAQQGERRAISLLRQERAERQTADAAGG